MVSSRDFGSKYNNLYIKTPLLIRPFSEFPSMVVIDKFDSINKLLKRVNSGIPQSWVVTGSIDHAFKFCLKYQGTNYFIVFWFIFMKKNKVRSTFRTLSRISWKAYVLFLPNDKFVHFLDLWVKIFGQVMF